MTDFVPGRVVIDVAQRKRGKYMTKCADIGYGFLPFSFSSFGELEKDAFTLLKRVRKFSMAQDIGARAAVHIFNRISFSIAKGVEAQIVSRLPSNFWEVVEKILEDNVGGNSSNHWDESDVESRDARSHSFVKMAELELWCGRAKEEYVGFSLDELKQSDRLLGFLEMVLSVQQLYRICTLYWDDKYNMESVSEEVMSSMRELMTEDANTAVSSSFLLDDNSRYMLDILYDECCIILIKTYGINLDKSRYDNSHNVC
ncbi:hypothetical protein Tco_0474540 [Tanacetum coccineum]